MTVEPSGKHHRLLMGTGSDNPSFAVILMIGSLAMLGLQDAVVKLLSSDVSLWQFQALRSAFNLAFLAIIVRLNWRQATSLRPKRVAAILLRTFFQVAAMMMLFAGIPFLSLAEIAAGLYVFPLFVAILSAVVLGETVGPRRAGAIIVGFAGTLLILKPGADTFQPVALLPVAAGFSYACTIMVTRRSCREESPVTIAIATGLGLLLAGTTGMALMQQINVGDLAISWPYLFTGWHSIAPWVLALVAGCSVLNTVANIGLVRAYQTAESSWLAPFDYSYLVFATFWGYVLWNHVPDSLTMLGMTMIACAGIFVAWRERRDKQHRDELFDRSSR